MKIILFAFFISLSLHILLFTNYNQDKKIEENTDKKEDIKKSNIKYVQIKKSEIPKVENREKIIKKELKKTEKTLKNSKIKNEKIVKKVEKRATSKRKKENSVENNLQNNLLKNQIVNKKESIQQKTLEDFLSQTQEVDKKMLSEIERLYGREFETFTKVQKAFLKKHLNSFKAITQRVLNRMGYPKLAGQLRLSGSNSVEFIFYPNGNIKNLKITNSSGYEIFDKYTLELIEIAYKDYPKPKTATKLKFNVNYRLY